MTARDHLRLAGIPVRIEPGFVVVVAILGIDPRDPRIGPMVSWLVVVTVSILVHEMGHAVAFKAFGLSPRIVLQGLGGVTSASGGLTPLRRIVVSLAGPLSALALLGLPAVLIARHGALTGDGRLVVSQVLWVNIGWSVLNLLPVLPLDGGQVFAAVADLVTPGRGRRTAQIVSVLGAVLLGLVALANGMVFGALLAAMFAGVNVTQLARAKADELMDLLASAESQLELGRVDLAESAIAVVLDRRPSGEVLRWASELAGWARLLSSDAPGAVTRAARGDHVAQATTAFSAGLAMVEGDRDRGISMMAWSMVNERPGPQIALAVMVAGRCQLIEAVAVELLAMGTEAGTGQVGVLEMLSRRVGYPREAAAVRELRESSQDRP